MRLTFEAALHMSATILPATRVSKMLVVAKLNTFTRATCWNNETNVFIFINIEIYLSIYLYISMREWNMGNETSAWRTSLNLKDVQGTLCEDGTKGGGQAELHQTLQMCHFLCFCFLTSLFQSAAVYEGKASVQMKKKKGTVSIPLKYWIKKWL